MFQCRSTPKTALFLATVLGLPRGPLIVIQSGGVAIEGDPSTVIHASMLFDHEMLNAYLNCG